MAHRAEPLITDKTARIPERDLRPHCSDQRFSREQIGVLTVFLAEGAETSEGSTHEEVEGLIYMHSQTVARSVHHAFHAAAWSEAQADAGTVSNVLFFEGYLARVLGRPSVDIGHMLSGVDTEVSGNPYHYFGIVEA